METIRLAIKTVRNGVFGSPTFVVGRELFWGDDRLEDAISWYSLTLLDFPEPDSLGG
jgi:hypothetical protein